MAKNKWQQRFDLLTTTPDIQTTLVDVHEAGHAVVAAYLRMPFLYATSVPKKETYSGIVRLPSKPLTVIAHCWARGKWQPKEELEKKAQMEFQRRITNDVLMTLAARAAVETHQFDGPVPEECYVGDEEVVRQQANELGVPEGGFVPWRAGMLDKARQIVAIPYVAEAISRVAFDLAISARLNQGVPAKRVRDILRDFKESDITALKF